ncbi:hypothetical protein [Clostridium sp.]|uniref:hypothetical protein n=1 Tax=Clostridium sp. TaxID=1506 RepID=UPI003EEBA45E
MESNIVNTGVILIAFFTIVISFIIKNKSKKDSYSKKIIVVIQNEYPIIVFLLVSYIIFNYLYISMNYSSFNIKKIFSVVWNQWDTLVGWNIELAKLIIKSIFSESILKMIIIGYFISKILLNQDVFEKIKYFMTQIKEINYKDFSIKTQEAKAEEEIKEKEIENIREEEQTGHLKSHEAKDKIRDAELEKEIIALIIDNNKLVKYIDRFVNKNSSSIIIPLNLFPKKFSLTEIDKLFNYEIGTGSVKLFGLKKDRIGLVTNVFNRLLDKGIVYLA